MKEMAGNIGDLNQSIQLIVFSLSIYLFDDDLVLSFNIHSD